jgi:hypothetical protein
MLGVEVFKPQFRASKQRTNGLQLASIEVFTTVVCNQTQLGADADCLSSHW